MEKVGLPISHYYIYQGSKTMRHVIYFTDQTSIEVDEAIVDKIVDVITSPEMQEQWIIATGQIINFRYITHISSIEALASHSSVIKPPSPQDLKDRAERERRKIISSPVRLVQRIHEKGEQKLDE